MNGLIGVGVKLKQKPLSFKDFALKTSDKQDAVFKIQFHYFAIFLFK